MRAALALTVVSSVLVASCSPSPTQPAPAPSAPTNQVPSPSIPATINTWSATSTVIDVSATRNSCATDAATGQATDGVGWTTKESVNSIAFIEAIGTVTIRTPYYTGTRTDRQFQTTTWQDGGFDCFVWNGDLTGSF